MEPADRPPHVPEGRPRGRRGGRCRRRDLGGDAGRPERARRGAEHPRDPRRPDARAALVLGGAPRCRPAAEPRRAAPRRRVASRATTPPSNDCTPARAALADRPLHPPDRLPDDRRAARSQPAFPTWGTMLREQGYKTCWFGKWHLTHQRQPLDARSAGHGARALRLRRRHLPVAERRARAGLARRPADRATSSRTGSRADGDGRPWCTTVSFVNPHDIAWWYRWTQRVRAGALGAGARSRALPPNFETPAQLERAPQAAPAALAAADVGAGASAPSRSRARGAPRAGCRSSTSTSSSSTRSTARSAASCAALRSRPDVAARTRSSSSPPTTASTAARTGCAARAAASTTRRSGCR